MDPASLAISVAALVETAAKLIEVLHDIKEGGKQRIRLIAEISSLWLVLENVQSQLDDFLASKSQTPTTYLTTLTLPNGPLTQCSELLSILYKKCKPRNGAERLLQSLKWSFEKDEVDRYLDVVHRLQTSINLAYAQTSLSLLNSVAADASISRRVLEGNELQRLMEWLSPIDFEAQQRQAFSEWCPGTVEWVLKSEAYVMFKTCDNPYLWCPAAPGSGKTILTSLVINDLRTFVSTSKDAAVLGVYLTSRSTGHDDDTFVEILGSLIKQLCIAGSGPDEGLLDAFRAATDSSSTLNIGEAISHLKRLLKAFSHVFLIIDAIDELQPHRRRTKLIQYLKDLESPMSVWLSGRPYKELWTLCAPLHHICDVCDTDNHHHYYHCEEHLRGGWDICPSCFAKGNTHCPDVTHPTPQLLASTLVICYEPLEEDICLYARRRIDMEDHLGGLLNSKESLKEQVIEKIVWEARNRFLTAKLFLNHVATLERARDIKEALKAPLGNLDQTYKQAWENLMQQRPDRVHMAQEVLKWVVCSKEPMLAAELEQAVQFSVDGDSFDHDDIVPMHRLLDFTKGFLTTSHNGTIEFIHFTADEFVSEIVHKQFSDGGLEIFSSCMMFMTREEFRKDWCLGGAGSVLNLHKQFPFYSYAVRNWSQYIDEHSNETSHDIAMSFLRSTAHVSTASFSLAASKPRSLRLSREKPLTALHMAAQFNMEFLVLRLLEEHVFANVDAQDHHGRTALLLCARHGHLKALGYLLDAGASPDTADSNGWTPLLVGIAGFHDDVVQTLINHPSRPANINLNGSGPGFPVGDISPLMSAVLVHNDAAIQFLLERKDLLVNTHYDGATPLSFCAGEGNVITARMLLGHADCNVNYVSGGSSALHAAGTEGHSEMIELLVSHGAKVDLLDGDQGSPLLHAIINGCFEAVCSLLEFGASVQARDNHGGGVLHYAACTDNVEIFKLLSSQHQVQSFIDLQNKFGDTALHSALRLGRTQYVNILRGLQASLDIANDAGETPRDIAQRGSIDLSVEPDSEGRDIDFVWMADVLLSKPNVRERSLG